MVKVFGCRQAYENRPSTNPRCCGDGSMGISRFAQLMWLLTRIVSAVCGNLMREMFRWADGESGTGYG
jgi:hypothetical protein